ncbi:hypothetical protein MtrunA17_Chr3g0128311 [Medicago truncatula]|uniref:Uncharacterized protein n=1 Tax=Medicago truncatula TaxID=3880 RepID=A0A396IZ97_MEDTR|nr:hypothetical protein MtrunA17_Chr3g0128311 [Medicago truncatula]
MRLEVPKRTCFVFGNMYRCKLTGLTHICDKNCNQRILYDNHSSLCRASGQIFPLTPTEEQAVRGVLGSLMQRTHLLMAVVLSADGIPNAILHLSRNLFLLSVLSAAKLEMAWI